MLLFLDVDGVLNCEADFIKQKDRGFGVLCSQKLDNLKRVFEAMPEDSSIVLSSTWRLTDDGDLAFLKEELKSRGMSISANTPDLTYLLLQGDISRNSLRGTEIEVFLGTTAEGDSNRDFLILDDVDEFYGFQQKNFVQTSFDDENGGLNEEKTLEAIALINKLK